MAVGPDLLKAAESNDHDAIDMVSIWGLGYRAELGGCLAPGLWMHGGAQRLLEQSRPGVLYADLAACNAYEGALDAAAKVKVPATVIVGERDMMTPAKAGRDAGRGHRRRPHGAARGRRTHDDVRAARRGAGGDAVRRPRAPKRTKPRGWAGLRLKAARFHWG